MRIIIFTLCMIAFLAGCSPSTQGESSRWEQQSLSGKRLELIDDRIVQVFALHVDGSVPASIGKKDGPVAAPILFWRIEKEVLIISHEPNSASYEEFRLLSVNENVLRVKTKSGEIAKFKISKN